MLIETKHHSSLPGLLLDTHTQYFLADGTRALTDDWSWTGDNKTLDISNTGKTIDLGTSGVLTFQALARDWLKLDPDVATISFGNTTDNPGTNFLGTGLVTHNGNVTILTSTPILVFQDSNSLGAASVGFIEWRDSGGGRAGFLGNPTSGNDDLMWKNEQGGNTVIQTTGGGTIELVGNTNVTGNVKIDPLTATDAILTMDGSSSNPMTLRYESDNELLLIDKSAIIGNNSALALGSTTFASSSDIVGTGSFSGISTNIDWIGQAGNNTGIVSAFVCNPRVNPNGLASVDNLNILCGVFSQVSFKWANGPDITTAANIYAVFNTGVNYTGTIQEASIFKGDQGAAIGGTIVNAYGLNLTDITWGTNNWAIKTGSGIVQFGDAIYFTQSDGAERIDSDADGTLDLYAGTSIDFHADTKLNNAKFLIFDKASGNGIKVDTGTPTYGWRDLEGFEIPDPAGGDRPTLSALSGGAIKENAFSNGDVLRIRYHIPHDYVKGTDIFSHIHWSHNGTAISGNVVFGVTSDYAKGHNQANFGTEKSISITYNTIDISTTPQRRQRIEESAITSDGGSGTLIDRGLLEPDGIILVTFEVTTNPTITGGSPNNVFVHRADLHYQSTNIATKDKVPDFYT